VQQHFWPISLLVLAMLVSMIGCDQGPQGAQGPSGPPGQAGEVVVITPQPPNVAPLPPNVGLTPQQAQPRVHFDPATLPAGAPCSTTVTAGPAMARLARAMARLPWPTSHDPTTWRIGRISPSARTEICTTPSVGAAWPSSVPPPCPAGGGALTPGDLGSRRVCPSSLKTAMILPSLPAWWHHVRRADALRGLRWALAQFLTC